MKKSCWNYCYCWVKLVQVLYLTVVELVVEINPSIAKISLDLRLKWKWNLIAAKFRVSVLFKLRMKNVKLWHDLKKLPRRKSEIFIDLKMIYEKLSNKLNKNLTQTQGIRCRQKGSFCSENLKYFRALYPFWRIFANHKRNFNKLLFNIIKGLV